MHMDRIRDLLAKHGADVSNVKTGDQVIAKLKETLKDKDSEINRLSERPTVKRIVAGEGKPKQTRPELPLQCQTALSALRTFCFDLQFRDPESDEEMDRIVKGAEAIMKRDGLSYRDALEKLAAEKPSLFRELEPVSPVEMFSDLVVSYAEQFKGDLDARINRFAEDSDPETALGLATEEYAEDSVWAEKFIGLMHPALARLAEIAEYDWAGFIAACRGAWTADVEGEAFAERIAARYDRSRLAEDREQDAIYKQYLKERGI